MATLDSAELLQVHHAGVGHLVIEVVAFTGTLTHTGKHRQAAVRLGDVVDEFHHVHGLAHTGATEQTHLAALGERAHQVNHLDAGFQQFLRRAQLVIGGCLAVNRGRVGRSQPDRARRSGVPSTSMMRPSVALPTGTMMGCAGVLHDHAATQAVGGAQRNGAHDAVAELLLHFQRQGRAVHFQSVIDLGHLVARKFHVHHGANTLNNFALNLSHFSLQKI